MKIEDAKKEIERIIKKDSGVILDIRPENFGWVFMVGLDLKEMACGTDNLYIVDKFKNIIDPNPAFNIKRIINDYQKKNGYELVIDHLDTYLGRPNKGLFSKIKSYLLGY